MGCKYNGYYRPPVPSAQDVRVSIALVQEGHSDIFAPVPLGKLIADLTERFKHDGDTCIRDCVNDFAKYGEFEVSGTPGEETIRIVKHNERQKPLIDAWIKSAKILPAE